MNLRDFFVFKALVSYLHENVKGKAKCNKIPFVFASVYSVCVVCLFEDVTNNCI